MKSEERVKRRESGLRLRLGSPSKRKARHTASSGGTEEKWVYKGHVDLVDLEVIVSPARDVGDERRLEILSPFNSFAVYAGKFNFALLHNRWRTR